MDYPRHPGVLVFRAATEPLGNPNVVSRVLHSLPRSSVAAVVMVRLPVMLSVQGCRAGLKWKNEYQGFVEIGQRFDPQDPGWVGNRCERRRGKYLNMKGGHLPKWRGYIYSVSPRKSCAISVSHQAEDRKFDIVTRLVHASDGCTIWSESADTQCITLDCILRAVQGI